MPIMLNFFKWLRYKEYWLGDMEINLAKKKLTKIKLTLKINDLTQMFCLFKNRGIMKAYKVNFLYVLIAQRKTAKNVQRN